MAWIRGHFVSSDQFGDRLDAGNSASCQEAAAKDQDNRLSRKGERLNDYFLERAGVQLPGSSL